MRVQPGDRALYDPALFSEAGSVVGFLFGDPWGDAAVAELFRPLSHRPGRRRAGGVGTCRGGRSAGRDPQAR